MPQESRDIRSEYAQLTHSIARHDSTICTHRTTPFTHREANTAGAS